MVDVKSPPTESKGSVEDAASFTTQGADRAHIMPDGVRITIGSAQTGGGEYILLTFLHTDPNIPQTVFIDATIVLPLGFAQYLSNSLDKALLDLGKK